MMDNFLLQSLTAGVFTYLLHNYIYKNKSLIGLSGPIVILAASFYFFFPKPNNLYSVIQLYPSTSPTEIKIGYEKLKKGLYSDDQFKNHMEIYETLTDPRKREAYDQIGKINFDYKKSTLMKLTAVSVADYIILLALAFTFSMSRTYKHVLSLSTIYVMLAISMEIYIRFGYQDAIQPLPIKFLQDYTVFELCQIPKYLFSCALFIFMNLSHNFYIDDDKTTRELLAAVIETNRALTLRIHELKLSTPPQR